MTISVHINNSEKNLKCINNTTEKFEQICKKLEQVKEQNNSKHLKLTLHASTFFAILAFFVFFVLFSSYNAQNLITLFEQTTLLFVFCFGLYTALK